MSECMGGDGCYGWLNSFVIWAGYMGVWVNKCDEVSACVSFCGWVWGLAAPCKGKG